MSGSGKGVSGMVGISQDGSGAGTFPDTEGPASRLSPSPVVGEPFQLWGEPVVTHHLSTLNIVPALSPNLTHTLSLPLPL